jgi:hypothetical protein
MEKIMVASSTSAEPYLFIIVILLVLLVLLGIARFFMILRFSREVRRLSLLLEKESTSLLEPFKAISMLAEKINSRVEQSQGIIVPLQEAAEVILDTAASIKAAIAPIIDQIAEVVATSEQKKSNRTAEPPSPSRDEKKFSNLNKQIRTGEANYQNAGFSDDQAEGGKRLDKSSKQRQSVSL